jgi:hypothetical protein
MFASFCASLGAEELDSGHVKAAYIYNFIKYIHWPDEENKATFTLAVYNDGVYYNILKDALDGRLVKGKAIKVINIKTTNRARPADLLYVSVVHVNSLSDIAAKVRSSQTLLVSDESSDKNNVMINLLYNSKAAAMSFEVNKSNIIYEQLEISADLLLFGGHGKIVNTFRTNKALFDELM